MSAYTDFLEAKTPVPAIGVAVDPAEVHSFLHPWQRLIVTWAVGVGRAAIWADTGLGKTLMQIEWARLSGERVLIVAPLAVCAQTVREAAKVDVDVRYLREDDGLPGIMITNYEISDHFDASTLNAVVLDESSILKDVTSKTRDRMIDQFGNVPARLCCTATPAPNDVAELANHAEFLGVATRRDMLSTYFMHDQDGWRLKGHARAPLYAWMATWAVAVRMPSDLGFPDDDYILPALKIIPEIVESNIETEYQLIPTLGGVSGRARVRRETLADRCAAAAECVDEEPDEAWLLWCGLNDEAKLLAELLPGSVNVDGSWSPADKAQAMLDFADGKIRYLITKPSIASFGLNWQHCARMAFVGLSDSYESYYQSIRRCYRYGQTREVHAHVILSDLESAIAANVAVKERQASAFTAELVSAMQNNQHWSAA